MAPPARRRFDSDEELRRKIEALAIMGVPPRLDEPRLDARTALMALADERDAAEGFSKDPEMPRPPSHLAKEVEPTVEQLYARQKELQLPDVPVQKPMPPKPDLGKPQPAYVEYQRDDNPPPEPPPAPAPPPGPARVVASHDLATADTAPQQEMGPPAPEDVIASERDPFDPRDPSSPVPTPEEEQARDPVVQARAALAAYNAAPALAPGQAPPPPGAVPRDLALAPGKAPPPEARRDYSDVAGRVASTPQQGASPDLFGHDDDGGFTRAEAIRQARAAYDRQPQQASRHWEDEFLASNPRMGNQEFRRRSIALGLFGGYDRMREAQQDRDKQQQQYAAGLERARLRDQGEQRISRAQAEAFAATGQISPEAAAQMRNNDRLIGQFGQFASQGGRAEHLDYQRDKMINELHAKVALQEARQEAEAKLRNELEDKKGATQRDVASTYANGRKRAEEAKRLTPDEHANLVGVTLSEKYGFSLPIGKEAARGNYANVPPELREKVEGDVIKSIGQSDIASARKLGTDVLAIPAKADEQAKAAGKKAAAVNAESLKLYIAKRKADPQFRLDYIKSWDDKKAAVQNAWSAWAQMSDRGKAAFTQWSGDGFAGQISDALLALNDNGGPLPSKDMNLIGPIQTLVNELVKERSGATVTDQEWGRLGREVGLANGSYSPFKGVGALEGFMKRAGQRITRHRQIFEETMGGWEKGP